MLSMKKKQVRFGHAVLLRFDEAFYLDLRRTAEVSGRPLATFLVEMIQGAAPMLTQVYKAALEARAGKIGKAGKRLQAQGRKAVKQLEFENGKMIELAALEKKHKEVKHSRLK